MNKIEKNNLIIETLQQAESIAILPSKIGGVDAFCAGAGFFHILKQNEKKAQLIYQGKIPDGCEDAVSKEEVTSNIKHRDLIVSIDYKDTAVEKIQYNTEDGVFYLKLGPVSKEFSPAHRVKTEIRGYKNDVYIIIGAQMPEDLGQVYHELERDLLTGKVINLDITDRNTRFGHYNIVDPLKDSMSLLMLHAALEWNFLINTNAAKAFLTGISAKKGFSA